ncbi:MAG TPA: HesA/MoeB/ThiF family protein [Desulfocapsa sulfexigens]|nr:HesA/MoeB/ThiF family protein [Desulfocapsa sulfexigens]
MEVERTIRNGLATEDQKALRQATVSIVGCGGLGGRTAELLVRLGIGTFILTDPDIFTSSNLNRQIFCTPQTLGLEKARVVASELQKINPVANIYFHVQTFSENNIKNADVVIDGLDSAKDRLQLAKLCRSHSIPLIHGAVKQWYGQAGVDSETSPIIDTLYSTPETDSTPTVFPMTVALIAAMQATEVCKWILQKESPLQNGWLQCDLLNCDYDQILQDKT